ncbi:MAG: ROK family protein [candidate division Zixibacteria bacterium]|nr:ROK family protein [candidate division Zixibacteria bacterium]
MVIAADVGGTKTVFASVSGESGGIILSSVTRYENEAFESFSDALNQFLSDVSFGPVKTLAIAAAGLISGDTCRMTNLNWAIEADELKRRFSIDSVLLLNDLFSAAAGLDNMGDDSFDIIQEGIFDGSGNQVLISPGTGLGEAMIIRTEGKAVPVASEGGHALFTPSDGTTVRLWDFLRKSKSRVIVEDVLSGPGIFNIYSYLVFDAGESIDEAIILCSDPGSIIVERALADSDKLAVKAVQLFLDTLAIEASNMALKALTTGGVIIGGGIVPRLQSMLDKKRFGELFCNHSAHESILEKIPIKIITDTELPLYGAAEYALAQG